jgi:hypothetical protein
MRMGRSTGAETRRETCETPGERNVSIVPAGTDISFLRHFPALRTGLLSLSPLRDQSLPRNAKSYVEAHGVSPDCNRHFRRQRLLSLSPLRDQSLPRNAKSYVEAHGVSPDCNRSFSTAKASFNNDEMTALRGEGTRSQ